MTVDRRQGGVAAASGGLNAGHEPANLGDILERVLDRGLVIVGDIKISLLDIELLTIKLRLLIASVDTARELGIDWWEHDPWLSSSARKPVTGEPAAPEALAASEDSRALPAASEPADRARRGEARRAARTVSRD